MIPDHQCIPLTHKLVCGSLTKPGVHLHSPLRDRSTTLGLRRATHCSLAGHWSSNPSVQYLNFSSVTTCLSLSSALPPSPLVPLLAVLCCGTMTQAHNINTFTCLRVIT